MRKWLAIVKTNYADKNIGMHSTVRVAREVDFPARRYPELKASSGCGCEADGKKQTENKG